jgi:hypothetical protein
LCRRLTGGSCSRRRAGRASGPSSAPPAASGDPPGGVHVAGRPPFRERRSARRSTGSDRSAGAVLLTLVGVGVVLSGKPVRRPLRLCARSEWAPAFRFDSHRVFYGPSQLHGSEVDSRLARGRNAGPGRAGAAGRAIGGTEHVARGYGHGR